MLAGNDATDRGGDEGHVKDIVAFGKIPTCRIHLLLLLLASSIIEWIIDTAQDG